MARSSAMALSGALATAFFVYHVSAADSQENTTFLAGVEGMTAQFEHLKVSAQQQLDWYGHKVETAWQYMLDNYDEFTICSIFTFILHEAAYFGFSLPWLLIDQIPFFRKYKIQSAKPNTWAQQWRCFKALLFNHIVIQFPMMLLFHRVVKEFGFSIELPLPPVTTMAWQVIAFFLIEDFYFYWIHRLLHHRSIYKYVHKVHHEHTHPFGISAEYAHPIETVFLGIGTILGPLFFARHLLTLWVWLVFRLYETIEDHSGYDLPFNPTNLIPFWGGPVHHDHHHKTFDGNYASVFSFWDWLFGTDIQFQEHQKKLAPDHKLSPLYPAQFRTGLETDTKINKKAD
eukprot:comp21631_c0_seq1/m.30370 comp21631_c0_seq1/g.30370  ORF comp21631_c0_seq1/g.30370 comp21631_c0_seq1/m.30370 type:complete len:343 (-) comp21631_c0_seq1:229-1257(-)